MQPTAKVFTTGNSQAVRLPKAFRVNTREMWITKNELTGESARDVLSDGYNSLSCFLKGNHPPLQRRMARAFRKSDIAVSAITRAEMRYGQGLMAADDKRRARVGLKLEDWMA